MYKKLLKIFEPTYSVDPSTFPMLYKFLDEANLSLLDVGRRGGVVPELRHLALYSDIYSVEPDPIEAASLHKEGRKDASHKKFQLIDKAIWRESGSQQLNITVQPGLSSLYKPNKVLFSRYFDENVCDVKKVVNVDCLTGEDILRESAIKTPKVIKLDTQGSELEILKSFASLDECEVVYIEVEFQEFYSNQPLFRDIDSFMAENGFELMDLKRTFHRRFKTIKKLDASRKEINWGHALYVKSKDLTSCFRSNASYVFLLGYLDLFYEILNNKKVLNDSFLAELELYSRKLKRYKRFDEFKSAIKVLFNRKSEFLSDSDRTFI